MSRESETLSVAMRFGNKLADLQETPILLKTPADLRQSQHLQQSIFPATASTELPAAQKSDDEPEIPTRPAPPIYTKTLSTNSGKVCNIDGHYIGLLLQHPPPEDIAEDWDRNVRGEVEKCLMWGTRTLPSSMSDKKVMTEPVLCMAGETHTWKASTVSLNPMVWIWCGSKRCKRRVSKLEIHRNITHLRRFLDRFDLGDPIISRHAPWPAAMEHSLIPMEIDSSNRSYETSYWMQQSEISACGLKLKAVLSNPMGESERYSTIGGFVVVNDKVFGLTTAHSLIPPLHKRSNNRDLPSTNTEADSETSKDEDEEPDNESNASTESDRDEETENSTIFVGAEVLKPLWVKMGTPKVLAYLGQGTTNGNLSLPDGGAPEMADFALIDLDQPGMFKNSYKTLDAPYDAISVSEVHLDLECFSGTVWIVYDCNRPALKGHLLKGKASIILRGVVMSTRKIQLEFPCSRGISGSWVIYGRRLCGIIYAAYDLSPYVHLLPAEHVFAQISKFLNGAQVKIAPDEDQAPFLQENDTTRTPSVGDTQRLVREYVEKEIPSMSQEIHQVPVLYGDADHDFFGAKKYVSRPTCQVIEMWDGKVRLNVGSAQCVAVGAVYDIYPSGVDCEDIRNFRLAHEARIMKVDSFHSVATLADRVMDQKLDGPRVTEGSSGVLRTWALREKVFVKFMPEEANLRLALESELARTPNLTLDSETSGRGRFIVKVNENNTFDIMEHDPNSTNSIRLQRLPVIAVDTELAIPKLAHVLRHVSRYRDIEQLWAHPRSSRVQEEKLDILLSRGTERLNGVEVGDVRSFDVIEGEPLGLRFKYSGPAPFVWLTIFELNSSWGVTKKYASKLTKDRLEPDEYLGPIEVRTDIPPKSTASDSDDACDTFMAFIAEGENEQSWDEIMLDDLPISAEGLQMDATVHTSSTTETRAEITVPKALPNRHWGVIPFVVHSSPSASISGTPMEPAYFHHELAMESHVQEFTEDSPDVPYLTFAIPQGHIASITCQIWSHDQGWSDDWRHHNTYDASYTWFEVRYEGTAKDLAPFVIQRNVHASAQLRHHTITWEAGQQSIATIDSFMGALEPGDRVGIYAKAQYRGWVNYVYRIRVDIVTVDSDGRSRPSRFDRGSISEPSRLVELTESTTNLDQALNVANTAVNTTSRDLSSRVAYPNSTAIQIGARLESTESINNLNQAIDLTNQAMSDMPQDHPDRAACLSNPGTLLGRRFERTGSTDDLNRAVETANMAVGATPQDHPDRAGRLSNLGNLLGTRFECTGSMDDLNRAIATVEMAVNTMPQDYPDRARCLSNLGNLLGRRFECTGSTDDLNRAVETTDMAVGATPQDHPDRAVRLSNLGAWLGIRFERTGSTDDLNRAVKTANMAVSATPQDHPGRAACLSNLAAWLGRRFERTGSTDDLNRAVETANMAVSATPQNHPDRAACLNNLGIWLGIRFERTGSMDDLDRAVETANMAVGATPQDHPDRAGRLSNLGNLLGTRFECTGSMDDLNRAIATVEMAVNTMPQDYPDRARCLSNLGNLLGTRFERTGSTDDLNRAVETTDMAVGATPQDHPDRAGHLNNLGIRLGRRFERTGSMDDLNRSISSFEEGWHCRSSPPSIRIRLAQKVAAHFSEQSSWARSSTLLEEAVELLPTVSLRSLQHTDKQHELERFAGLASMAAATALNAGKSAYHALKLLELGRGVIAGLLLEMRSDVSELEQRHPQLAEEFVSLRDELDSSIDLNTLTPIEDAHSSSYKQNRRWAAEKRIEEVLAEIRLKDGFQNFLLPPTEDELKRAASAGPIVVVNVSPHRCDAFLVRHDLPISVVELPDLRLKDIESHVKSLHTANSYRVQQMLEWLWDVAARPVLEALNLKQAPSDDDWPRIWWIPTGQLGQLPLHAAGRHSKSSADTVLDRAISSYSSSIKALVYGRRQHGQPPAKQAQEDAVLITVPDSGLHFARQEVEMLEKLCPSLKLNPKKPAAKREEILAHLRTGKIFHFASHGRSNPSEPSESCLVLGKDEAPITVANLRDCRLQESSPFLAYLSACSTKVNQADTLADEEIHLVSACQLAGFRHVIGTLWEVSDKHCVDVAHDLYTTLAEEGMTDMAICRGLHRAIRELRNKDIEAMQIEEARADGDGGEPRQSDWGVSKSPFRLGGPLLWAAYVHAGL